MSLGELGNIITTKNSVVPGSWGRGWSAVGPFGKKRKDFFFFLGFILFFSHSFGKEALCSRAVTVKIRFKLQASPWLSPFLSEFLPTCNLLNEILLFRLTGIFCADVDLT